jgi:hypothetical protein
MEARLVDRGADQAVLLSMLAWAHGAHGTRAANVVETVER